MIEVEGNGDTCIWDRSGPFYMQKEGPQPPLSCRLVDQADATSVTVTMRHAMQLKHTAAVTRPSAVVVTATMHPTVLLCQMIQTQPMLLNFEQPGTATHASYCSQVLPITSQCHAGQRGA